jgi:hypothetical protein
MLAIYFTYKPFCLLSAHNHSYFTPDAKCLVCGINSISILFSIKFHFKIMSRESFINYVKRRLPFSLPLALLNSWNPRKNETRRRKGKRNKGEAINKLCYTSITYRIFIFDCQPENLSKFNSNLWLNRLERLEGVSSEDHLVLEHFRFQWTFINSPLRGWNCSNAPGRKYLEMSCRTPTHRIKNAEKEEKSVPRSSNLPDSRILKCCFVYLKAAN